MCSNRLGLAWHGKGDFDRAVANFDTAIELDSNYAAAYLNRANARRSEHDLDHAKMDYEAALKLKPGMLSAAKALQEVEKLMAKNAPPSAPARN